MERQPDFYLTCMEMVYVFRPRACYIRRQLLLNKKEVLLVDVSPVISPWEDGEDISEVILAPHFIGCPLIPIRKIKKWPLPVYVCRINSKSILEAEEISNNDSSIYLWGEIYQTLEEANHETAIHKSLLLQQYRDVETI